LCFGDGEESIVLVPPDGELLLGEEFSRALGFQGNNFELYLLPELDGDVFSKVDLILGGFKSDVFQGDLYLLQMFPVSSHLLQLDFESTPFFPCGDGFVL
jgi:hypothetical protein